MLPELSRKAHSSSTQPRGETPMEIAVSLPLSLSLSLFCCQGCGELPLLYLSLSLSVSSFLSQGIRGDVSLSLSLSALRSRKLPLVHLFPKLSLDSLTLQLSFETSALAGRLAALDALLGALGAFPAAPQKNVLQTYDRKHVQGAMCSGRCSLGARQTAEASA